MDDEPKTSNSSSKRPMQVAVQFKKYAGATYNAAGTTSTFFAIRDRIRDDEL